MTKWKWRPPGCFNKIFHVSQCGRLRLKLLGRASLPFVTSYGASPLCVLARRGLSHHTYFKKRRRLIKLNVAINNHTVEVDAVVVMPSLLVLVVDGAASNGIGLVSRWNVTSFSPHFLPDTRPHSLSARPSLRGETRTAASA